MDVAVEREKKRRTHLDEIKRFIKNNTIYFD